jgi:hypothetical protein
MPLKWNQLRERTEYHSTCIKKIKAQVAITPLGIFDLKEGWHVSHCPFEGGATLITSSTKQRGQFLANIQAINMASMCVQKRTHTWEGGEEALGNSRSSEIPTKSS